MATTYEDFTKAAKDAGLEGTFDTNDLDFAKKYPEYGMGLISLKQDLGKATTNEQKLLANEAINQLRKNYGSYWTGDKGNRSYAASYGSKINDAMDEIGSYGPFEYSGKNRYQDVLDRVTDFHYDPEEDESFGAYKKMYNREGDRAAANALATSAAATGGRPSSYATTAASEAGNYYAAKLADVIPTLREQAMNELLQGLSAMGTQRDQEYQEYTGRYDQMNQNLKNLQNQDEIDYKRYLDMVNAEYKKERDAVADKQQAWDNAWNIYLKTGRITGPLVGVIQQAAASGGGGGGSGGGGGGSSGGGGGGSGGGGSVGQQDKRRGTSVSAGSSGGSTNVYRGVVNSPTMSAAAGQGGTIPSGGSTGGSALGATVNFSKTYRG